MQYIFLPILLLLQDELSKVLAHVADFFFLEHFGF